ncbi:PAS domain-containing protein [Sinorhizobium meliloti]|nr:PAS domain-containing protein [Sinorhizobium meliloti]RVM96847.1 PAS domain-containing protein [Sinorhizobium meliloti]RVN12504.1 PAS domain-containing protein [Sinorhizobium meliloti]
MSCTSQIRTSGKTTLVNEETEVILNAIPQPIIIKDEYSRFRFLNDAACELTRQSGRVACSI